MTTITELLFDNNVDGLPHKGDSKAKMNLWTLQLQQIPMQHPWHLQKDILKIIQWRQRWTWAWTLHPDSSQYFPFQFSLSVTSKVHKPKILIYLYLFLKAQKFFKSLHNRRGQEFIKMIFPHLIKLDFLLSAWSFLAICLPWCIQKYVSSQTKQNTQFYCFHIENIHDWAFSKLQTYAIFQPVFFAFVNFTYVDCCTTYANVL